jgi:YVTN family beta-propeller protein
MPNRIRLFSPKNGGRDDVRLRISGLLAVAVFAASCLLASAQTLAQNAYITNQTSNTVSVIDTTTNAVIATISVGGDPEGVAVTPNGPCRPRYWRSRRCRKGDGRKVYVANTISNTVSVIDTTTNAVIATIPVGISPQGVTVTPDGSKVYVTNSTGTVSVINTTTNAVVSAIPVGSFPFGVAVTPDGRKVYVANDFDNTVSVIDTATNTVIGGPITVGSNPIGVAVTPDGRKVYVANSDTRSTSVSATNTVSVIDTTTNTVIATVNVGSRPFGVAVTPDGSKVYVANTVSSTVSVIDTTTNTVIATISVGFTPVGVSVTPDGSKVYVANYQSNNVSLIDTAQNAVIGTIPVGFNPYAFGVFIQPPPRFAGTPGKPNCYGQSLAALAKQYGGLAGAAAALGYSSVRALQNAMVTYCAG